jgi:uncharacterized damage-inducible protein DinB
MQEQLLETWAIHDRINRYLLAAIPEERLGATSASRGRSVGEQFAHIHNVRRMWLNSANPVLVEDLRKIEGEETRSSAVLRDALEASGGAVAELLRASLMEGGRVKGFKPHAVAFLGYLISHESHHRGQIVLALKQSGLPLEKKVAYGLWEWGVR